MQDQQHQTTPVPSSQPPVPSILSSELKQLSAVVENACALLIQAKEILSRLIQQPSDLRPMESHADTMERPSLFEEDRIVEGVFNGNSMIGVDGKVYQIPPNYASKSKLVEGDRLKLTIRPNGMFVYKQVLPVERDRRMGVLERDPLEHGYRVRIGDRAYKVLTASVTYYHGQEGDEVAALVPRGSLSSWAAVENIIRVSLGMPSIVPYNAAADEVQATPPPIPSEPLSPPPSSRDPLGDDITSLLSDYTPPPSSSSPPQSQAQ